MPGESQRKNERIPFTGPVRFHQPTPMEGKGIDIGAGGMGAETPQPIANGAKVEIEMLGVMVAGTVRMSAPLPNGGSRLGIQFASESPGLVAKAKGA